GHHGLRRHLPLFCGQTLRGLAADRPRRPAHRGGAPDPGRDPGPDRGLGARPARLGIAMRIEPMTAAHAEAVLRIYQAGIDEGNATFETSAPTWEHFDASRLPEHRFVAVDDTGAVLGWVAAVPVSDRCAYAGV